ncbi:uncharacterized protein LY89DRAFT_690403 [Mollisia scopiformis]|uniref:F-box domain-containing protein n=1 Tax=Mollisia scopiformis TaxID=149040 RepID=A0A132BAE8_MOLSC|nr:uncharacterized protein LY89DRAFT_690403 [Mollisia scopiformis]KUJ09361.1 hypothetical protein LY89DRAFT_690403 [Mollisia scopiformis]
MSCSCCTPGLYADDFEPYIDANRLAQLCRLDNSKTRFKKPMVRPEQQDCRLQKLPVEVYHNCLQFLDVGTLTSMRAVSQYTRSSIDSLHHYKELYKYAPQALRACLSTAMAPHIPLLRLHEALTTMECYYCKQSETSESVFGDYLSLFKCRRICAFCARNSPLLKPAELTHLIMLCSQRKSSLSAFSLSSIPHLKTLPGSYSPTSGDHRSRVPRTTLILALSIPLDPNKPLAGREARTLTSGSLSDDTKIYHHPFCREEDESDISPSIGYTSPETERLATLRYTTAISLPYLTSTKKLETGVLCAECNLRMRYMERLWFAEQRHRRMTGGNFIASAQRRDRINELRKTASRSYVVDTDGRDGKDLSIREHYRIEHGKEWQVSQQEAEWRERHKGPALPLLTHGHFWQPPKPAKKVVEAMAVSEEMET